MISRAKLTNSCVVNIQPREIFRPSDFICIDDLDELLDKQEGIGGFELLADTHILVVKKRNKEKPGKEHWNTTSIFDISNENTQIIFVAKKEIMYKCFVANAIIISVLTDTYTDPVFTAVLKYSGKNGECCKISTSSGKAVGYVKMDQDVDDRVGFFLENELDNKSLKLALVQLDGENFVYDVWDGPNLVAALSSENSVVTVYAAGSLNISTKVILLGFSFYLDGLTKGDDRNFSFF